MAWTLVLLAIGCKKPEDDIGLDLLPSDRLEVGVDTAELHAFTVEDDSLRTVGLSRQLLGSYLDPQFGLTKAGIVTQVRLPTNGIGAGMDTSGLTPDSLVLALEFAGINYAYGNLDPQVFEVYELSEELSSDSAYTSNHDPLTTGEDLVLDRGGRIKPRPLTRPEINNDTLNPQLRIRLSGQLAERFMNAFGTNDMSTSENFVEFFKGFHVTVDPSAQLPNQGGILYFDLLAGGSKAILYYHDLNDQPEVLRNLDLPINSNCIRFTVVEHDHTAALDGGLGQALADIVSPQTTTYVQALAGTRTSLRFPNIMDFATQGQLLAKAELIASVHGSYYPFYQPPAQLFVFRKDENGADAFLPDQLNGIGAIDGLYRPEEGAYHFNITRYIQGVMNGTYPNGDIQLIAGSSGVTANRVILDGPADEESPMVLRLTFTQY